MTQAVNTGQFYERQLAPLEIEQRKDLALDLMSERDDLIAEVETKRREIRALNKSRKQLEVRIATVRREARSGKALEPRQAELPMLAPESEPEPEIDKFAQLYPMARTHEALRDYLADALAPSLYAKLGPDTVETWHIASGIFDGVAHWARIEKAHQDAAERARQGEPAIAGLTIPARMPMPEKLAELVGKAQKKKRARKA